MLNIIINGFSFKLRIVYGCNGYINNKKTEQVEYWGQKVARMFVIKLDHNLVFNVYSNEVYY